jgi:hypothetical protein
VSIVRRSAIHPTVIVVSARKRAAKAPFIGSPLVRAHSTLNLRAMTGECFGCCMYQYQELILLFYMIQLLQMLFELLLFKNDITASRPCLANLFEFSSSII